MYYTNRIAEEIVNSEMVKNVHEIEKTLSKNRQEELKKLENAIRRRHFTDDDIIEHENEMLKKVAERTQKTKKKWIKSPIMDGNHAYHQNIIGTGEKKWEKSSEIVPMYTGIYLSNGEKLSKMTKISKKWIKYSPKSLEVIEKYEFSEKRCLIEVVKEVSKNDEKCAICIDIDPKSYNGDEILYFSACIFGSYCKYAENNDYGYKQVQKLSNDAKEEMIIGETATIIDELQKGKEVAEIRKIVWRNIAKQLKGDERYRERLQNNEFMDNSVSFKKYHEHGEMWEVLEKVLKKAQLTEKQAQIFVIYSKNGSITDTAKEVEMSTTKVAKTIYNSQKKILEVIKNYEKDNINEYLYIVDRIIPDRYSEYAKMIVKSYQMKKEDGETVRKVLKKPEISDMEKIGTFCDYAEKIVIRAKSYNK